MKRKATTPARKAPAAGRRATAKEPCLDTPDIDVSVMIKQIKARVTTNAEIGARLWAEYLEQPDVWVMADMRGGSLARVKSWEVICQPVRGMLDLSAVAASWRCRLELEPLPTPFDIIPLASSSGEYSLEEVLKLNTMLGDVAERLPAISESAQVTVATSLQANVGLVEAELGQFEGFLSESSEEDAIEAVSVVQQINQGIAKLNEVLERIHARRQALYDWNAQPKPGFTFNPDEGVDAEGTTVSSAHYGGLSILTTTPLTPQQNTVEFKLSCPGSINRGKCIVVVGVTLGELPAGHVLGEGQKEWSYDGTQLLTQGQVTHHSKSAMLLWDGARVTMSMDFASCRLRFYRNGIWIGSIKDQAAFNSGQNIYPCVHFPETRSAGRTEALYNASVTIQGPTCV